MCTRPDHREPQFSAVNLLLLACLQGSCASQAGFGRASALPKGTIETFGAANVSLATMPTGAEYPVPLPYADILVGASYGLTERVAVGGRLWGLGIEGLSHFGVALDSKLELTPPEPGRRWHAAVAGALGYHQLVVGGTPLHVGSLNVPVLFGRDFGAHHLAFGPRLTWHVNAGQGQSTIETTTYGASVGFGWRVARRLELFPEAIVGWSPVGFNGQVESPEHQGASFLHLALGARVVWPPVDR
ncbi:MAG: hypothetical protein SFV15_16395 [Polyangiaceae bacterium]|nr:hypothetical protein [Polyangiaceae bacterium]